ncbi:AbrB/MazE/SpoVT family DNA-binding domain-containing protein [Candidatus Daviesbacteria bacterium]|nr:AbrB/MazE/SpoVT family DNA-binding domain-containing protein [Candidatus Daviesbacteria bacterium]
MPRKVFKNGNSLAVTVPKAYAHELSIRDGSRVEWQKTDRGLLLVNKRKAKGAREIDPRVAELIDEIDKKYTKVWQDLADL